MNIQCVPNQCYEFLKDVPIKPIVNMGPILNFGPPWGRAGPELGLGDHAHKCPMGPSSHRVNMGRIWDGHRAAIMTSLSNIVNMGPILDFGLPRCESSNVRYRERYRGTTACVTSTYVSNISAPTYTHI